MSNFINTDGSLATIELTGRRGTCVVLPRASEVAEAAAILGGTIGIIWAAISAQKTESFGASERMSRNDVATAIEALAITIASATDGFKAPKGEFGDLTLGAQVLAKIGARKAGAIGVRLDIARGVASAATAEALQVAGDWHHGGPIHHDGEIGGYWRHTKNAEYFIRSAIT